MTRGRSFTAALGCLLLAAAPSGCSTTAPTPPPVVSTDGVEIKTVLLEVQKALDACAARLDTRMPPLDSVTLTLQASVAKETGGKIGLFFIAFGHSVQREATQELTVVLTPPKIVKSFTPPPPTLADQLVAAIVGAVNGVQEARDGKPPLEMKSLELVVSFVVEKDTDAKAGYTIQPVTANLGADFKEKAVQKLRLVFKGRP